MCGDTIDSHSSAVSCRNAQKYHTAQNIYEVGEKDLLPPRIHGLRWRTLNEDSASRSRPVERGRSLNTWRTIQVWAIEMQCARLCLDNMHLLCFYAPIQGPSLAFLFVYLSLHASSLSLLLRFSFQTEDEPRDTHRRATSGKRPLPTKARPEAAALPTGCKALLSATVTSFFSSHQSTSPSLLFGGPANIFSAAVPSPPPPPPPPTPPPPPRYADFELSFRLCILSLFAERGGVYTKQ
ncbi:hypothetical protein KC338_g288 [Hortaea werneckii]|nr:hypothetical protein KC338_g288 [Hortaea werneckii]